MKVFISYSTSLDQLIALRLQTLAAVYGMTVYVPPADTRDDEAPSSAVQAHLAASDVVLAVITQNPGSGAIAEMDRAVALKKLLIPIVADTVRPACYQRFPSFVVRPEDPSAAEHEIVQYLLRQQQQQRDKTALLALATLTVGLMLFGSESR